MSQSNEDTLRTIGAFLAGQPDIHLGHVFGSLADGRATAQRDLDIAVLGAGELSVERRIELIGALAQMTGRPVDLIDLDVAGLPITRSALMTGQLVYAIDETIYPSRITRMLIDSADFLPIHERILNERRKAWLS